MADRKLVNLQVTDEQKERWNEYVEQSNEHKSLSQLIRFTVEREIGGSDESQGSVGIDDEEIQSLREENRELNAKLDSVAEAVERIENRLDEPSSDTRDLANEIFGVLPFRDTIENDKGRPRANHAKEGSGKGTVESVAERMDTDEYRTLQALDLLERDMSMVKKADVFGDGETRYYRDEDEYEVPS